MKPLLVFDVESLGLHGEGFGFGYVVLDGRTGENVEEGIHFCSHRRARFAGSVWTPEALWTEAAIRGDDPDRLLSFRQKDNLKWIETNVVPHMPTPNHEDPISLRKEFWGIWRRWEKQTGATLWAEWGWPVEARFLAACVDDALDDRCWTGPCPLHEIATVRRKAPQQSPRLPNELPIHNPLADARQSARLLWEALQK